MQITDPGQKMEMHYALGQGFSRLGNRQEAITNFCIAEKCAHHHEQRCYLTVEILTQTGLFV